MHVIIDGHNLIGKMSKISLADPNDEDKLVRTLARHLHSEHQKLIVVFDKGAELDHAPRHKSPKLRVIFAPPDGSADAIIIDMIKRDPNPKGLTIVSSDNEIRRCARRRRARLVSSEDFAKQLELPPKPRRGGDSRGGRVEDIDVDEWLAYFEEGRT
ncbi:MAG: NYN domain-containing protein [Candidatus Hydrogenedentota bacterium]|nr:MAG: NYN domain-containing protein [Candidatus Hydrogenedentota bacterium]